MWTLFTHSGGDCVEAIVYRQYEQVKRENKETIADLRIPEANIKKSQ